MISVEEALGRVLQLCAALPTESVPLRAALGRHMAAPAASRMTQPPFDASAMDGYAVAGVPVAGAVHQVIGEAAAGRGFDGIVGPGEAVRIFTGAPVPQGASYVVLQEDVTSNGTQITIGPGAGTQTHLRPRGQDFVTGQVLAPKRLGPADLGLLAAMNLAKVSVFRRPVVAILSTGDELIPPGEAPAPGQIIGSSAFALAALAETAGAQARILPTAQDNLPHLRACLDLASDADVIVTLGGASVGDHDLISRHAGDLGLRLDFWKVALRPGKPMMAGRRGTAALLGLPGNPVSAYVCAVLFLLPMLRAMQGDPAPTPHPQRAALASDLPANGPRRHYLRAIYDPDRRTILPASNQDSALTLVLAGSNALIVQLENSGPIRIGQEIDFLPLP